MIQTEVCIVGAGPAGATLAHFLNKQKIEYVLLDKAAFPRDKVCGDGITVDVLNVLKRIDPALLEDFSRQAEMLPSWGFCFRAPNGRELRYDFSNTSLPYAPFYTSRRLHLDDFLLSRLNDSHGTVHTNTKVTAIEKLAKGFRVFYENSQGQHCLRPA
ncbi:MAG: FAD-dependent monooxygenase [Owenweeksia sp.]|nr:FAD-dependent monooxygenase [Owenweeksia sp.]